MQRSTTLLVLLLLLAGGFALFASPASGPASTDAPAASFASQPAVVQPVNAVLGDESFVVTYGRAPTASTPEDVRLRTHLAYVEGLLRARDASHLSASQRANRLRLLDRLHAYWRAGVFPRNTERPGRTPVFIDAQGRLCAVGYLIAQSVGLDVAERINSQFKYAHIKEITLPLLDEWAQQRGFTERELAMIQPSYCMIDPNHPLCPGPNDPPLAKTEDQMNKGVEITSMSLNASAALVNGFLIGTGRQSRLAAGIGLVSGGAGLAIGLSDRANYSTADLVLAGSSILLSGWSLLRDADEPEENQPNDPAIAHRSRSGPTVRPALVSTYDGRLPGLHVSWQF